MDQGAVEMPMMTANANDGDEPPNVYDTRHQSSVIAPAADDNCDQVDCDVVACENVIRSVADEKPDALSDCTLTSSVGDEPPAANTCSDAYTAAPDATVPTCSADDVPDDDTAISPDATSWPRAIVPDDLPETVAIAVSPGAPSDGTYDVVNDFIVYAGDPAADPIENDCGTPVVPRYDQNPSSIESSAKSDMSDRSNDPDRRPALNSIQLSDVHIAVMSFSATVAWNRADFAWHAT